jgi:putative flavoprotein involved in K+ transport
MSLPSTVPADWDTSRCSRVALAFVASDRRVGAVREVGPAFDRSRGVDLLVLPPPLDTGLATLVARDIQGTLERGGHLGRRRDIVPLTTRHIALLADSSLRIAENDTVVERHDAVVVGAGPAGLAAAFALGKRGFETVVIESSGAVGARWRSRYDELRLNSWRPMSKLQGKGMPRSSGRYPSRDDVVAYLDRFATRNRIRVQFNTILVNVQRADPLWRLESSTQPILARYLVIATGWDAVPESPQWPGTNTFVPELIHSSEFRTAQEYLDKDVLVVGAGNSGIDIASHLVKAGARVTVSMRTPPNLASREVFGIPGQPLLVLVTDHMPLKLADSIFSISQRLTFGNLNRFGVPRAPEGVYASYRNHGRNPAIDDGFIAALKGGIARVVAEVQRLDGSDVVLVDGTRLRPDAVICATGYRRGLEQLVGHLGVLGANGVPLCHSGAPEHPIAPRLYFCGMWGQFSGQIRLGPIHARRIAQAAARDRRNTREPSFN